MKFFTAHVPEDNNDGAPPREAPKLPSEQEAQEPKLETPPSEPQEVPEFTTPIDDDMDRLDMFHGESHVWYRRVTDVIGDELVMGQSPRVL
jgi:hypothetical protein